MAGRENQGDLWDLSSGLDLQLPTVCADFRTLSLASVHNLGHRLPQRHVFNEVSSRSSMNLRMVKNVSEKRFYIFKMIKLRLRWVNRTLY